MQNIIFVFHLLYAWKMLHTRLVIRMICRRPKGSTKTSDCCTGASGVDSLAMINIRYPSQDNCGAWHADMDRCFENKIRVAVYGLGLKMLSWASNDSGSQCSPLAGLCKLIIVRADLGLQQGRNKSALQIMGIVRRYASANSWTKVFGGTEIIQRISRVYCLQD